MAIRVFLAEDHAVVREGLGMLLQAEADLAVVGEASDGREAVRKVKKLKPDVVIMDIAMPGLNGIEAAVQIKEESEHIHVIILSMHAGKEHIQRALLAGVRGYLIKDSAAREVVDAVRAVHSGSRYFSQRISEAIVDDYLTEGSLFEKGHGPLESLSIREREILQLVVEGKTSAQIAEILFISPKTVETYRSRLMNKLGISDVAGLVRFAIKHGIISIE